MEKYIGKTLDDRYILTEVIGVGGMAVVYKAFDRVVNRVVAVKILKEEFMSDAQFRRRFSNESKAITMLSQNNIVDVYGVCLEGDIMYIVMEYIDGITLKEYIDKVKILDWKEASFYIKQILKAMSHAHERGIVHRDLKPHNIMLLRDGTIKVTDFGIAKLYKFDTQTITDKAIGSVHYISPEQASGDRTDEKTDIYSVGVMFYEMLTGTLPFVADSPVSVALMQVQAQPVLPREINSEIPAGIEEIVIKAMMKSPDMRYSSALLMFNDILKVEENDETVFGYLNMAPPIIDEVPLVDDEPTQYININQGVDEIENDDLQFGDDYELEDESVEEEESKFKSVWLPIISGIGTAILVVVIVVLSIIYWPEIKTKVGGLFGGPAAVVEKVTVQNYIGQNYDDISKENNTGLKFQRENVLSDKPMGEIIDQDPAANTEVEKGSTITFKVSTGKETVQIPDITNKPSKLALEELFNLGIEYRTSIISSETVEKDHVIRTNPKANTEIQSDKQIVVYISSGPEIVLVEVPDLINRSEADAVKKLTDLKLKSDEIYEYDDDVPAGCVISQNKKAGTKVEEGETIELVISKGPKPNDDTDNSGNGENTEQPDDGNGEENTPPDSGNNGDNTGENTPPDSGNNGDNTGESTPPDSGDENTNSSASSDNKA